MATITRRWQLTNLDGNNNKFWEYSYDEGLPHIVTFHWGRVGTGGQYKTKTMYDKDLSRKVYEQERQGYAPVDLHRPQAVQTPIDVSVPPQVQGFVGLLFQEAGEHITTYLQGTVDALSQNQIAAGRSQLAAAQQAHQDYLLARTVTAEYRLADIVQRFYNTIPTKLPGRINKWEVVQDFCATFHEQETRLDQLEAALSTYTVAGGSQYASLGAEIDILPPGPVYEQLARYVKTTLSHGYDVAVREIYQVRIPGERQAWESCTIGKDKVLTLFHGTQCYNIRHILKSGMRLPTTQANGWNFGRGIYFADRSSKSINYIHARHMPRTLLVCQVALGRMYTAPSTGSWTQAPNGHDSVFGKAGYSGRLMYNEYVVFRAPQQTLRFLITLQ